MISAAKLRTDAVILLTSTGWLFRADWYLCIMELELELEPELVLNDRRLLLVETILKLRVGARRKTNRGIIDENICEWLAGWLAMSM